MTHRGLDRRDFLFGAAGLSAAEKRAVMIFDAPCRVENDPTADVRKIMETRPAPAGPLG